MLVDYLISFLFVLLKLFETYVHKTQLHQLMRRARKSWEDFVIGEEARQHLDALAITTPRRSSDLGVLTGGDNPLPTRQLAADGPGLEREGLAADITDSSVLDGPGAER